MLFSESVSYLAARVSKTKLDPETLINLKNSINFSKVEVSKSSFWNNLRVDDELVIIPKYETGLAVVLNNSRTVTLSNGGVVSNDFKGRFFKSNDSSFEYEITDVDVSTNSFSLKSIYLGSSSANRTYYIRKHFYRVPSDILSVMPMMQNIDRESPFEIDGYDDYSTSYSSGTILLTKNSDVLNGVGTNFLDNVYPGDKIIAGYNYYHVKKIISDTEITMTNKSLIDYSSSYSIVSESPWKAYLINSNLFSSSTEKSILRYSYIKKLYFMVNDDDSTEMPSHFDECILDFAKAEFGRITKDANYPDDLRIAQLRLNKLKLDRDLVFHSVNIFKQQGLTRMPGRR